MFYRYNHHHCLNIVTKGSWLSDCGLPTQLLAIPSIIIAILGLLLFIKGFFTNNTMEISHGIIMMLIFVAYDMWFFINFGVRKWLYLWKHP